MELQQKILMYLLAKVKAFLMEILMYFILSKTEQLKTGEFLLKLM